MRAYAIRVFFPLACGVALGMPATCRAASCTVSANPANFGNYDPLRVVTVNRTSRITVSCSGTGTFTVILSTGQSGAYNPRYMTSGSTSDQLDYNLYTNPARTIIFGDGSGGTQTVSRNFRNNTKRVPVYGQIPAQQDIAAGNYTDNVDVTVSF